MTTTYIVVEGKFDQAFLETLLPSDIMGEITLIDRGGKSAALSAATTLMLVEQRPVALVVDADTTDEDSIREQGDVLHRLMAMDSLGTRFGVFLAVPEIEIVLVQDEALLERMAGHTVSDKDRQEAQQAPARYIKRHWGQHKLNWLDHLQAPDCARLRQHPLIAELMHFLMREIMVGRLLEATADLTYETAHALLVEHFPGAPEAVRAEAARIAARAGDPVGWSPVY